MKRLQLSDGWVRALPFAALLAFLVLRSVLEGRQIGIDGRWLYLVQSVVPALLIVALWGRYAELRNAPTSSVYWLAATFTGFAVFAIWINATAPWMTLGASATRFEPVGSDSALRWDLIGVRMLGAVLVVPLVEELFWRSFVMRVLDRRDFVEQPPRLTSPFALIASSAVFALEHDLWLAGLIAGLAYGYLYRWTQNLWYPIAAHAFTNLLLAIWVVEGRRWEFW